MIGELAGRGSDDFNRLVGSSTSTTHFMRGGWGWGCITGRLAASEDLVIWCVLTGNPAVEVEAGVAVGFVIRLRARYVFILGGIVNMTMGVQDLACSNNRAADDRAADVRGCSAVT
jgi:hypothetical protein